MRLPSFKRKNSTKSMIMNCMSTLKALPRMLVPRVIMVWPTLRENCKRPECRSTPSRSMKGSLACSQTSTVSTLALANRSWKSGLFSQLFSSAMDEAAWVTRPVRKKNAGRTTQKMTMISTTTAAGVSRPPNLREIRVNSGKKMAARTMAKAMGVKNGLKTRNARYSARRMRTARVHLYMLPPPAGRGTPPCSSKTASPR